VASLFLTPLLLFLVGVCLFIALLSRQWELTVLCLLVFTVAGTAKGWTALARSGLASRAAIDRKRSFPGERLTLSAQVENRRCLPISLRVGVPAGALSPPNAPAPSAKTGLLWYQQIAFRWELIAARRGVHAVGPLRVTAGDLFGFFTSRWTAADAFEVLVYPRILPLRPSPLPRRDFFGIPGAESPVRDPVYILGTREYQHGGPAKHIHWKASARHHRLQEKLFEPTEQEKVLLAVAVDGFARQDAGEEFERTLEAVASLAVRLEGGGCAVGVAANGNVVGGGAPLVPVGRSAQQLPSILELMARLTMRPAAPLMDVLGSMPLSWGMSCVGFALEQAGEILLVRGLLARRRVPVTLFVARAGDGPAEPRSAIGVRRLEDLFL
jgi:uncharacterized protein (DUF58 family)